MAGGHGELRGIALEDGKPGGLRQRDDLRLGVGQGDPIAHHQHRPLGAEQERGDLRHAGRIDPPAPARVRRRLDVDVGLLVQRVHRQREEDRSPRRLHRHLEGAAQGARDVVGVMDLGHPLADGSRHVDQRAGQVRLLKQGGARRLARVDDQRRLADCGVVQHAEGVAEPRRDVDLDEGRPASDARVGVGHANRHALVQRQHEFHLRVVAQGVHEPLLGGARVAEDAAHPIGHELLDHRALTGHPRHGRSPGVIRGISFSVICGKASSRAHLPRPGVGLSSQCDLL